MAGFPSFGLVAPLDAGMRRLLDGYDALMTAFLAKEHNDDGTHGAITVTSISERSRTTAMGEWTSVLFNAANFTAAGAMTWTLQVGDQIAFQYMLVGKTLHVNAYLDTTTIAGALAASVFIKIPGGFSAAKNHMAGNFMSDNGVGTAVWTRVVTTAPTLIEIGRVDGANFTASVNLTYVRVSLSFEVV